MIHEETTIRTDYSHQVVLTVKRVFLGGEGRRVLRNHCLESSDLLSKKNHEACARRGTRYMCLNQHVGTNILHVISKFRSVESILHGKF